MKSLTNLDTADTGKKSSFTQITSWQGGILLPTGLILLGTGVIAAAIFGDLLTRGGLPGFGIKQLLLALDGAALLASGVALLSSEKYRSISEWILVGISIVVIAIITDILSNTGLPELGVKQLLIAPIVLSIGLIGAAPTLAINGLSPRAFLSYLVANKSSVGKFLAIVGQLCFLIVALRQFDLENRAFSQTIMSLILYGFVVHFFLPLQYRLPFFLFLSLTAIFGILGLTSGLWLIAIGLGLVGVCHLPIALWARVAVLVALGALLALLRTDLIGIPWSTAVWPILGSMFMFRLIVYLYDLKHQKEPATLSQTLAYFFLLPNLVFPLFPVVDYSTFRRTYYDGERYRIYQTGIDWMCRGVIQLILYRFVSYYLVITPEHVTSVSDLIYYLVTNFLLYLRVSGQFHLIIGILHLFGFNLPETHHLYYLASSFTDFWRRINIYWKDFMLKVFYYPTYFQLRKWGNTTALVLSTLIVFVVTWFFHAYQWFWLRGTFLLTWPDTLFWAILALLVIANSLYEVKYGRKRTLKARAWTWRGVGFLTLRTVGTFSAICVLWSLWTSASLTEWMALWSVKGFDTEHMVNFVPAFLLLGLVFGRGQQNLFSGLKLPALKLPAPSFFRSAAVTACSIVFLCIVSNPAVYSQFGAKAREFMHDISVARLNERDAALLQRGYYEDLVGINRFNSELWEIYMKRPRNVNYLGTTSAMRLTNDFLKQEMVPSVHNFFLNGVAFSTNRWAMRDQDYAQTPPPNTYRIAILGASSVLGSGVEDQETFESLLEEHLNLENQGHTYAHYELLNFGVSDYSAIQQAMILQDRVFSFAPNALFYMAHHSDEELAVLHLANRTSAGIDAPYAELQEIVAKAGVDHNTPELVAKKQLTPFGSEITAWAYREIVARCQAQGVLPVWVFMPLPRLHVTEEEITSVEQLAEEAGFTILNLSDAYANENIQSLWVADWDQHPNAKGHRIFANRLYDALRANQDKIPLGLWP